jgi:hypothetical protein
MTTTAHQTAIDALHAIRDARGQERDSGEITQDPLSTRNNLAWALRRQSPPIPDDMRAQAHAALLALGAELG